MQTDRDGRGEGKPNANIKCRDINIHCKRGTIRIGKRYTIKREKKKINK